MSQKNMLPPFLIKTFDMVEDPETNHVISWNQDGKTFVVWDQLEFSRDLLPTHFKHNNFASFVRQLNTYGFRKISPSRWEFANEFFCQGKKDMLCEIHRRKTGKSNTPDTSAGNSEEVDQGSTSTKSSPKNHVSEIAMFHISILSNENKKLKENNFMLSSELVRTKNQCKELIHLLSKVMKMSPDKIVHIMKSRSYARSFEKSVIVRQNKVEEENKEGEENEKGHDRLKLFGVCLKKVGEGRGKEIWTEDSADATQMKKKTKLEFPATIGSNKLLN